MFLLDQSSKLVSGHLARGYNTQIPTGALAAIYLFFLIAGTLSIFRSLPFALALGVSRRSYYAGTALLAVALAAVDGLALAVLAVIEQASGGAGFRCLLHRRGRRGPEVKEGL